MALPGYPVLFERFAGVEKQLGHRLFRRQWPHRTLGHDDHQGHDGGPGPTGKFVDAEAGPGGQEDEFHRQQGDAVPTDLAEEGQEDAGEDPGLQGSAPGQDKLPGLEHPGVLRGEPGDLQSQVGFDAGAEFAAVADTRWTSRRWAVACPGYRPPAAEPWLSSSPRKRCSMMYSAVMVTLDSSSAHQ